MIIVAKYQYHSQYESVNKIVGVFTNKKKARERRQKGDGYVELYEVKPNSMPMVLTKIDPRKL